MNLLRGICPVKGRGEDCTHYLSFSGDRLHQADAKVASGAKGKICRFWISRSWQFCLYSLIIINYNHRLFSNFFFAATADVYRNKGNEAFKKGDFINAIHFYTKGIKMNCNEKELKAKLHNNRAIAHFKLGKMMRALICIFFPFWSYWVVNSSFLKKVLILNVGLVLAS